MKINYDGKHQFADFLKALKEKIGAYKDQGIKVESKDDYLKIELGSQLTLTVVRRANTVTVLLRNSVEPMFKSEIDYVCSYMRNRNLVETVGTIVKQVNNYYEGN